MHGGFIWLIGISFDDIRELFGGRCTGIAVHRSVSGGGEAAARQVARDAVAAAKTRLATHQEPTSCFFIVYIGDGGTLQEVDAVNTTIQASVRDDCNVVPSAVIDSAFNGKIGVTVVAVMISSLPSTPRWI